MPLPPNRRTWIIQVLIAASFTAALAASAVEHRDAGMPATMAWQSDASSIAGAGDNAARLDAIRRRLEGAGFEVASQPFTSGEHEGLNLLAPVAGDVAAPLLLLGAHADRVEDGEGAVDNASGAAVVLALAERFRQRPLANHRVAVAFWDLEERGLLGARHYVGNGGERPSLYVNFDVFGWGDTLWMMAPDLSDPLVAAGPSAAAAAGTGFSATAQHYPPTDHLAFLRDGWPAVSYSLLDADEISALEIMMQGEQPDAPPRVMQVIHTAQDTRQQLDAPAVARGIEAVEAALREWDAGQPEP